MTSYSGWLSKRPAEEKSSMDSDDRTWGCLSSAMMNHAGTCTEMRPDAFRTVAGVKLTTKLASVTAIFSEELVKLTSCLGIISYWKADIDVSPRTRGSLARSHPA